VNCADSTSNNVHFTGVQLEVGEYTSSTIPPFQHESYGDNLARCMRYYSVLESIRVSYLATSETQNARFNSSHAVVMRAAPTSTISDAGWVIGSTTTVYEGYKSTTGDASSPQYKYFSAEI
jgi:hypothetical protein